LIAVAVESASNLLTQNLCPIWLKLRFKPFLASDKASLSNLPSEVNGVFCDFSRRPHFCYGFCYLALSFSICDNFPYEAFKGLARDAAVAIVSYAPGVTPEVDNLAIEAKSPATPTSAN